MIPRPFSSWPDMREAEEAIRTHPTPDPLIDILASAVSHIKHRDELFLDSINYDCHNDNGIEMSMHGENGRLFICNLLKFFYQNGAENFLAITINPRGIYPDGPEKLTITFQDCSGEDSPAEKIARLEKRIAELEASDVS